MNQNAPISDVPCGTLASIQRGRVVTEGEPGCREGSQREWTSAFRKTPITGPVEITAGGIAGDEFGNPAAHGGIDKAVLFYASDHYDLWKSEYPNLEWGQDAGGGFGENLTVTGIDETNVCIGDHYQIGDVLFEISQPRAPCWKINRRWNDDSVLKRVTQTGRTGWYARVIHDGVIRAGAPVLYLGGPHPDWSIAKANDISLRRNRNPDKIKTLLAMPELAEAWKESIA